jgi:hypothetical protein
MGIIFGFLILLLVGFVGTVFWFGAGFADAYAMLRDFLVNTDAVWFCAFAAVVLAIGKIKARVTGMPYGEATGVFQACMFGVILFFGLKLFNANQTNADFKCEHSGQCYMDDRCVSGFCARTFRGEKEHIGKAEFTQGNYKIYLTKKYTDECAKIKNSKKQSVCDKGIEDAVGRRFQQVISPEHCKYMDGVETPEEALYMNDDAPMVCLGKDEAAQICADLGGRLPSKDDYDWMFDDRTFSCENTVMFGIDEFHGYAKTLKAREIEKLSYGNGCGTGKFRKVCDKADGGNNEDGLCDVWGNVAEWAEDGGAMGGSYRRSKGAMKGEDLDTSPRNDVGFRCIIGAD